MATLFELTGMFNKVAEMFVGDEENQAAIDTLESLDMEIEDKADGYAKIIRNMESDSKAMAEEIKRIQERKKVNDNRIKSMKLSLENTMISIGKTKFKTPLFSFNIQKNPPSVEILDEDLIPEEFKKIEVKIDKSAIKKVEGDVPGIEIKQTESLRIR